MAIYECKYRIGPMDIGKTNEITNKGVLKVLEYAGGRHSNSIGYGINQIYDTKLSWVLLNWKVKIIKRPIYDDLLIIKTWPRGSNKIITYRDYEIYDESNNLLIQASSKWTLINIDTKELEKLPLDLIEKFNEEDKTVFEDGSIPKLKEPTEYLLEKECKVTKRDIDVNEHVHNVNYLDIAYECLPNQEYNKEECNNIEILYKKQIKLDDEIKCLYSKENDVKTISIKSNDNKELHSIIKLY